MARRRVTVPNGTEPARARLQMRVGLLAGGVRVDAASACAPATDHRAALLPPPPRVSRVTVRPRELAITARGNVVNRRTNKLLNWG